MPSTPMGTPCGDMGGIEYEELDGSGDISIAAGSMSGKRLFNVAWADRITFAEELTGIAGVTAGGITVNNSLPQTFPGYSGLRCSSVTVKGWGNLSNSDGEPVYDWATVTATYTPSPLPSGGGGGSNQELIMSTHTQEFTNEVYEIGPMRLQWVTSGVIIPKKIQDGKKVVIIKHTLTEEESQTGRSAAIEANIGKVNGAVFDMAGRAIAVGKLLYLGANTNRTITSTGEQPWKIQHTLYERPEAEWNQFFDDTTLLWDDVQDAATGAAFTPYDDSADNFGGLFE
jgi:hypothetical protein